MPINDTKRYEILGDGLVGFDVIPDQGIPGVHNSPPRRSDPTTSREFQELFRKASQQIRDGVAPPEPAKPFRLEE